MHHEEEDVNPKAATLELSLEELADLQAAKRELKLYKALFYCFIWYYLYTALIVIFDL